MGVAEWTPLEWLVLVQHELLLFAAVFFLIGAIDEFAIDLAWAWLRLTGRARTGRVDRRQARARPLAGRGVRSAKGCTICIIRQTASGT